MDPTYKERNIWEARTTLPTRLKISPKDRPITPHVSRWSLIKDKEGVFKLRKTYQFETVEQRRVFFDEISDRENATQHFSDMLAKYNDETKKFEVTIDVWTRNINVVMDADKEFAAYCDIVYKDITEVFQ